jgi:hypothetical protein
MVLAALLASPAGLEQEPYAAFGFVDPGLEQAGGGHVAIFAAQLVSRPHIGRQSKIIFAKLGKHVFGSDEIGIIVRKALHPRGVPQLTQGGASQFAHTLGDGVQRGVDLIRLLIQQQMMITEVRP